MLATKMVVRGQPERMHEWSEVSCQSKERVVFTKVSVSTADPHSESSSVVGPGGSLAGRLQAGLAEGTVT